MAFFDIDTVMMTVWGYPLSWIEFVGTLLYFASVWLIARKNLLTWPIGIVSVILFAILFWQIRLYSDMAEQAYYLVISIWGWISWRRLKPAGRELPSGFSSPRSIVLTAFATLGLGLLLGALASRLNLWLPAFFPEPASYPYIDALTTVGSFVAMFLLARRRAESWIYWILIDAVGIRLYWIKDVRFIALQYVALFAMAGYGFAHWTWKRRPAASRG